MEVATLLLDRCSSTIDEKTDDGATPLHFACHRGHVEVATLLLDRGSLAIDEKTGDGKTPLHCACHYAGYARGKVSIVALLLDRGCDFDVEEYKKGEPYRQEVSELLLAKRGRTVQAGTDDASLGRARQRRFGKQSYCVVF